MREVIKKLSRSRLENFFTVLKTMTNTIKTQGNSNRSKSFSAGISAKKGDYLKMKVF